HEEECSCGHHHEHHHDHDEECECGHHHHHDHDHEEECSCGHHHHGHHHHHHDADEVFSSVGCETAKRYTKEQLLESLKALNDTERFGTVLRAKGIVAGEDGKWYHFDFTPEEEEVREGSAATTGLLCIIGAQLNEAAVKQLFGV
ncbi:MAG: GTP-binding protein, partial [Firmicutes bacterium]|nr:GTP-binding protein [Bacillota bacterium]